MKWNLTHGQYGSRLYWVWATMKQRCQNPKARDYRHYGRRGVRVCKAWQEFDAFARDMAATYAPGLTLERKNNDHGYTPKNCCWASRLQQSRNQRPRATRAALALS